MLPKGDFTIRLLPLMFYPTSNGVLNNSNESSTKPYLHFLKTQYDLKYKLKCGSICMLVRIYIYRDPILFQSVNYIIIYECASSLELL